MYAAGGGQAFADTFRGVQLRAVVRAAAGPAHGQEGTVLLDMSVRTALAEGFADAVAGPFRA